jgi:hypothetical protein
MYKTSMRAPDPVVRTTLSAIAAALVFVLVGIQMIQNRLLETCAEDACALARRLQTPEVIILAGLATLAAVEVYRRSRKV